MTKRDDMPALPEPFVKPLAANGLASKPGLYTVGQFVRYAKQYAEQRVREERAEDERLLREAMGAMDMLMDALWKATGDDPECPCCREGISAPHEYHLERRPMVAQPAAVQGESVTKVVRDPNEGCECGPTCEDRLDGCRYATPPAPGQVERINLSTFAWGVTRMGDNPKAVLVSFRSEPTDDDLRALHEALRPASGRTVHANAAQAGQVERDREDERGVANVASFDEFTEASDHCLLASEQDLRRQAKALHEFALPALRWAEAQMTKQRDDVSLLDWLDAKNKPFKMGWQVGVAPAGNVVVKSVIYPITEPVSIRSAIRAARSSEGGPND